LGTFLGFWFISWESTHRKTALGNPQDLTVHGNLVASVTCFGCALFVLLEPLAQELIACCCGSNVMLIEAANTGVEQTKQGFHGS